MTSSLRLLLPLLLVACYGDTPSGKDSGDDSDPDTPADDTDAPPDDTLPPATLPTPTVRFVDASPTSTDDLVAEVVSPDPEATYTWAWKLDGAAQADLTDPRVLGSRTLRGQTWEALATAHKGDEVSAPGSAQVVVRNAAPYATVAITPEAPTTEAPLVAVPTPGDPDGDAVTFTWQWRVDGLLTGNTGATVPAGVPLKGQTWEVTATPRDDQEDGEPARASIVIGDAPPRVNNVVVLPEAPRTDTPLTASAGAVDPDNDRLTTTWAWYVNGVLVNGATTNRLDAARFAKGDRVAAEATASDGQLTSAPVRSAELVIGNTAPALQDVRLTPEVADAATTLTCAPSGYTDLDGDPQGARLRWLINGVELAGQTGATLGAPHLRRDQAVTCAAAPFDGTDAGEELLSNVVTIRNSAPRIGSVSLSTQSPADGESITAQAVGVIDDDGDRVTIGWQWYVNGNAAGLLDRLPAGSFGAGDRIWVVATPSDGTDSGAPVRSADAFGANTPPEAYNVRISPSSPHTDDVLVASADGRDVDHHQVTFRWRWAVDGQEVAGATTNLLDDSLFHKGQRVVATATPWDGYAEGAAVASPPVQIRNSAPSLEAAQISPSEVYETSTLTCAGSGWSDADGDPPAWHTAWTVNGVAAGTSDTLDGAAFSRGDTIRCQLQPDDGENIGGTVTSAAVQARNTPPVADAARLSDTQPGVNTTLSVTVDGARDVDGDDVWFTYVWRVDGDAVATTATLPGPHPRGGHIDVEVTPHDATTTGPPVTSDVAIVGNARPVVTAAAITPQHPTLGEDVRAVWEATDDDGDALSPGFRWYVNDRAQVGQVDEELPATLYTVGDRIRADVFVSDGYELSDIVRTDEVVVANQPPTVDGAVIEPSEAWEDTVLRCVPGTPSDPEGQPVTFQYGWLVNGVTVVETSTLDGSVFSHGDRVVCRVTPLDPYDLGASVDSDPVVIQNTPPTLDGAALSALTLVEASRVSVVPGTTYDLDNDTVRLSIDWYVSGIYAGSAPTLDGVAFGRGDTVWAEVTPTDGEDEGASVLTDTATVGNTAPAVTAVFLEPREPLASDTITASAQTSDVDGDAVTVTWTWLVDEVQVQSGPDATLAPPLFGSGDRVRVIAVPSDGTYSGAPYSSGTITVDNTPPTAVSAAITPAEIYEYTIATCSGYGFADADGDPEGWEYRWKVNGALDASDRTLTGARFRKGDALTCLATPWDGTSRGAPVESPPVIVRNTPPTIRGAALSRTDPVEGNTLYVVLDDPRDDDNDPLDYTWAWYVNDVEVSDAPQLDSNRFRKGDRIYAVVVVSDGEASATATSNTVTVANSLPVVLGLTLTPTSPVTTDDLVATFSTYDADGDAVTVAFVWTVDDEVDASLGDPIVPATRTTKHEVYRVTAIPNDGESDGAPLASDEVEILNTPPVMTGISVGPQPFSRTSSLTCAGTGLFDADGDPVVVDYKWWVDGVYLNSSATLEGYLVARDNVVFCTADPYDLEEYGLGLESERVTVANAPPTVAGVILGNTAPKEGDTITATAVSPSDPDGDAVVVDWSWRVNGAVVGTTSSITSEVFNRGDRVQAFATPRDGSLVGNPVGSDVVVVLNAPPALTQGPTISPSAPTKASTLSSTPQGSDPDGDRITWEYSWYVQGALVQSSTTVTTLAPTFFNKGQGVYVSIRGTDGTDWGPPRVSSTITIRNTPPSLPTVSVTPASPRPGVDNLVCTRTNSTDLDNDTLQYEMRWRDLNVTYGAAVPGPNTLTLPGSVTGPGEVWYCEARVNDGSGWSGWSTPAQVNLATLAQRSCADAWLRGGRESGLYTLETEDGAGELAWCDQETLGGGWTRVLRTGREAVAWGQDGGSIVDELADAQAAEGVYGPFDSLRGFSEVMLVQTDGAQASRYAAYELWEDAGPWSLRELLEACRDDVSVSTKARLLGHTAWASGRWEAGDLRVAGAAGAAIPQWFSLCGARGADGYAYLAFTEGAGAAAGWSPLWAFASGPGPLGTPGISAWAGWRGAGTAAEPWHAGDYELYLR